MLSSKVVFKKKNLIKRLIDFQITKSSLKKLTQIQTMLLYNIHNMWRIVSNKHEMYISFHVVHEIHF